MRKLSVVFVALAMVFAFSVNAMAAQAIPYTAIETLPVGTKTIEVYGSARMQTFIMDRDRENVGLGGAGGVNHGIVPPGAPTFVGNFDDTDLTWSLDEGSSRFGVRFKSGKIGANVEIRPSDGSQTRHWYGSYNLGFGTLIVGQTWTPVFNPICNECLIGGGGSLDGYGDLGLTARRAGFQLHMPIKGLNGLLKLALLQPDTANAIVSPVGFVAVETDTTLPMFETSLSGAFGPLAFTVRGGYKTTDFVAALDREVSVDSFVVAADLTYSMGPFYVRGSVYTGQNFERFPRNAPPGTYGFSPTSFDGGLTVEDVTQFGFFGVAGFKFNDMISVEAGYGQRSSEIDRTGTALTDEEDSSAFVLFAPISITPAFVITPTIYYTDEKDITVANVVTERGKRLHYGAYWRIDF